VTIESSGIAADHRPAFVAERGGTAYRRGSDGICKVSTASPAGSLVALLEPAHSLVGVMGAEALDHKDVNGAAADGYHFDERALGYAGSTKSTGEVWVATNGGHILSYTSTSTGDAALFGEGITGTRTIDYELTDINTALAVDVPADCPPGLVGAPMMPDASGVVDKPGMLLYHTSSSLADVVSFYAAQAVALDWTPSGDPLIADTGAFVDYARGTDVVTILIAEADGARAVTIVVNGSP
jgi:hypothetical protein